MAFPEALYLVIEALDESAQHRWRVAVEVRYTCLVGLRRSLAREEKVFFRTENVAGQYSGPLADLGGQAIKRRERFNQQVLERLAQLDPAAMSPENRISYRVFLYERETERDSYRQPDHYYLITNRDGWHNAFATAPADMSFSNADDYRLYLQTLADFPRYNGNRSVVPVFRRSSDRATFCSTSA